MRQKLPRAIGTLGLVFILFFCTSGGPYTTETLIHTVGPGLGLLILLVPIIWSVPEVLIIGELSSMLPEEGGYYRWVDRAFGRFWAFQNGWLTWVYSLVDMAIYPVLFNQYLRHFIPVGGIEWIVSSRDLGRYLDQFARLASGPRLDLCWLFVLSAFSPSRSRLRHESLMFPGGRLPPKRRGLGGLAVGISIALWNYIGWDNASTVQGEVKDASRNYPRALALALPLVMLGYFIPLLVTLGATDWTTWAEGGWP